MSSSARSPIRYGILLYNNVCINYVYDHLNPYFGVTVIVRQAQQASPRATGT